MPIHQSQTVLDCLDVMYGIYDEAPPMPFTSTAGTETAIMLCAFNAALIECVVCLMRPVVQQSVRYDRVCAR